MPEQEDRIAPYPTLASCPCGAVELTIGGVVARFMCHCSICQRVNQAPFGEPVFAFRWKVSVNDKTQLAWKRHTWNPIHVNRGTCRTCGQLMLEYVTPTPFAVVIGPTWHDQSRLPPARGHAFYDSRVADIDDGLPKSSGYLSSQLAITKWVTAGLFGR